MKIKLIKPVQIATAEGIVKVKRDNYNNDPGNGMERYFDLIIRY
jgi:hypothetical protein